MRQTSGSIICPSCGKLIEVDEERCPFCGRWQPGMFGYSGMIQSWMGMVDVTAAITGFCILLYLISLVLDPRAILGGGAGFMGILAPSGKSLVILGRAGDVPLNFGEISWQQRWFTMFSANYLHGGLLHIFFNMLWIRILGPTVEDAFGVARFFLIFMAAGLGGYLSSNVLLGGVPTVGASAGVFGLLAATVAYGRRAGGSFGSAISQRALMWAGFILVLGFMPGSRTNNVAHIGGFAWGYLAALAFLPSADRREGPALQLGALALALASVASVIASIITIFPYVAKR